MVVRVLTDIGTLPGHPQSRAWVEELRETKDDRPTDDPYADGWPAQEILPGHPPCIMRTISPWATAQIRFFSSCMFSPRPRISLVSTSKLAGVPASRVFSPLTMLS